MINEIATELMARFIWASFAVVISGVMLWHIYRWFDGRSSFLLSLTGWVPLLLGLLFLVASPLFTVEILPSKFQKILDHKVPLHSQSVIDFVRHAQGNHSPQQLEGSLFLLASPEMPAFDDLAKPAEQLWFIQYACAILFAIWAGGLCTIFTWWTAVYFTFVKCVHLGGTPYQDFECQWQELLADSGVRTFIPMVASEDIGPALGRFPNGYLIVIPKVKWATLGESERLVILRHELSHFRRGHIYVLTAARLLALLHWFNPIAWVCLRRIETACEWEADDDAVGGDTNRRFQLAHSILAFVDMQNKHSPALVSARGSKLRDRIVRMIDSSYVKESKMKKCIFLAISVLVISMSWVKLKTIAEEPIAAQQSAIASKREAIELSKLRQELPRKYLLDSGDVLGISLPYVLQYRAQQEAIEKEANKKELLYDLTLDSRKQCYPVSVLEDGAISPPLIKPVKVRGLTLEAARSAILKAYVDASILMDADDEPESVTLALLAARSTNVVVFRNDQLAKVMQREFAGSDGPNRHDFQKAVRGCVMLIRLPAYQNDILNALMETGGLPQRSAGHAINVVRAKDMRLRTGESIQIPLWVPVGSKTEIRADDVLLYDGDVVSVGDALSDLFSK